MTFGEEVMVYELPNITNTQSIVFRHPAEANFCDKTKIIEWFK